MKINLFCRNALIFSIFLSSGIMAGDVCFAQQSQSAQENASPRLGLLAAFRRPSEASQPVSKQDAPTSGIIFSLSDQGPSEPETAVSTESASLLAIRSATDSGYGLQSLASYRTGTPVVSFEPAVQATMPAQYLPLGQYRVGDYDYPTAAGSIDPLDSESLVSPVDAFQGQTSLYNVQSSFHQNLTSGLDPQDPFGLRKMPESNNSG